MIVYSANIGSKDAFLQPKHKHPGVEYVYFVEDKTKFDSDVWDVQEIKPRCEDTRMEAKWYKMHSHLLFPGEDTVWVDGNYKPTGNPNGLITDTIVLYEHASKRRCLYEEAEQCLKKKAGDPKQIENQIAAYRADGMPNQFGLYQGNVLLRRPEAVNFNEAWWKQVQLHSARDQISLPYVLWREQIPYTTLKHTTKRDYFFKCGKHRFHGTRRLQ